MRVWVTYKQKLLIQTTSCSLPSSTLRSTGSTSAPLVQLIISNTEVRLFQNICCGMKTVYATKFKSGINQFAQDSQRNLRVLIDHRMMAQRNAFARWRNYSILCSDMFAHFLTTIVASPRSLKRLIAKRTVSSQYDTRKFSLNSEIH